MEKEQGAGQGGSHEQDRFLPIANISRIMKKTLPGNVGMRAQSAAWTSKRLSQSKNAHKSPRHPLPRASALILAG